MKKSLFLMFLALVIILGGVTPAYAAERSLGLESIVLIPSKGVVFTFIPHGAFAEAELAGQVRIDSETYQLACRFNDEGKVKCEAEAGLARLVGLTATGQVAGYDFSGLVRTARVNNCYKIFDKLYGVWQGVSNFCGTSEAKKGDWIIYKGRIATFDPHGPAGMGFYLESKAGR